MIHYASPTVFQWQVREADGKGSERLSMFNEMLHRPRTAASHLNLEIHHELP